MWQGFAKEVVEDCGALTCAMPVRAERKESERGILTQIAPDDAQSTAHEDILIPSGTRCHSIVGT